MKSILRMILAVVCILVIALCATLIVRKLAGNARIDLTEQRLYTLSDGTRNILGKLTQPVKLTLYYSRTAARKGPEQIRYYNNYYLYVRDVLDEYVGLANGKLTLERVDPRKDSDEEEEAIEHGIRKFPISEDENFFFGLVAQTELGKEKVIEFFEPNRQEFVEYDISKLISSAVRRDKTKIGILSSLPVMGAENLSPYMVQMMRMQGRQPPPPWTIVSHLREEYDVEKVATDARAVPDDIDYLMVVHPKKLGERTLFAIDQFVMKGGKLLVFVDPHCVAEQPPTDPRNPYAGMSHDASSGLNELLEGWGVEMAPGAIAADRWLGTKVRLRDRVEPLITYLSLDGRCVNKDQVITAKLHSLRMLFAGSLQKIAEAKTTVTPLLTTTKTGGTWTPKSPFELRMPNPEAINREVATGTEPVLLACLLSGKLKTNFPDGMIEEDEGKNEDADGEDKKDEKKKDDKKPRKIEAVQEASEDAAVLVFADVDVITDGIAYQQTFFGMGRVGDNAALVLNAIEFLSGTGDLIATRSRGRFQRPFKVVDRIEAEAEMATAQEKAAVNQKIERFRKELEALGASATDKNIKLVRSAALAKRQKLQLDIRKAEKELRKLGEGKRKRIEALAFWIQFHNMIWAPAAVLLIAIGLAVGRQIKARRYAARRMES